ncbi:MAG: hypothetical protein ABSE54_04690 [Smithella sp.]
MMNVAINAVTFVLYGTVMEMVFAPSSITADGVGLVNENAVMAFSESRATVTVTVYVAVEPSAAVTM